MALPFMVLGIFFVLLWLLAMLLADLLNYAISFFLALKVFILFGEWKWVEVKREVFPK
ncbi:hypothetical protein GVX76_10370 [[Haemophilus] felis]|nr:hypothetical protein [[Haemophilus] felis]